MFEVPVKFSKYLRKIIIIVNILFLNIIRVLVFVDKM